LESRATQLEIATALPVRSWQAIRRKIRGVGVEVPDCIHLRDTEIIHDYLERNPLTAGAIPFSILTNSSRQISLKTHSHRTCRLNLAALSGVEFLLLTELNKRKSA
jgi:hypothetical protein